MHSKTIKISLVAILLSLTNPSIVLAIAATNPATTAKPQAPTTLEYKITSPENISTTPTSNAAAATLQNSADPNAQAGNTNVVAEPTLYPITKLTPVMREQTDPEILYTVDGAIILPHLVNFTVLQNTQNIHEFPVINKYIDDNIIGAGGNQILVTAPKPLQHSTYSVIRKKQAFIDPNSKQALGTLFIVIGTAKVLEKCQDTWKMQLINAAYAIEPGDMLIPKLELDVPETIYAVRPKTVHQGQIIAIHEGMLHTGKYQNIFINLGKQDGVEPWKIYDIFRMNYRTNFLPEKKYKIKRKYKNPDLKFSAHHYGKVMIYKVFDKVSVGIVMESKFSMAIMDVVSSGRTFCEECPVTNDDPCSKSK